MHVFIIFFLSEIKKKLRFSIIAEYTVALPVVYFLQFQNVILPELHLALKDLDERQKSNFV